MTSHGARVHQSLWQTTAHCIMHVYACVYACMCARVCVCSKTASLTFGRAAGTSQQVPRQTRKH